MTLGIQQAPFPPGRTLTFSLGDRNLRTESHDQASRQHLTLHTRAAHRQVVDQESLKRPGADLQQGLGKVQIGRLDNLSCLQARIALQDHRLGATQCPAMTQQDPGGSATQQDHGHKAPELNQQGLATLTA